MTDKDAAPVDASFEWMEELAKELTLIAADTVNTPFLNTGLLTVRIRGLTGVGQPFLSIMAVDNHIRTTLFVNGLDVPIERVPFDEGATPAEAADDWLYVIGRKCLVLLNYLADLRERS